MAKAGRRRGSKGRGWGVPFPKLTRRLGGFSQAAQGQRSEEDLLRLQDEWVVRYTARVRAHHLLGLSMGVPLDDVEERYHVLRAGLAAADPRRRDLDVAFNLIQATAEGGSGDRSYPTGSENDDGLPAPQQVPPRTARNPIEPSPPA